MGIARVAPFPIDISAPPADDEVRGPTLLLSRRAERLSNSRPDGTLPPFPSAPFPRSRSQPAPSAPSALRDRSVRAAAYMHC